MWDIGIVCCCLATKLGNVNNNGYIGDNRVVAVCC